MRAHPQALAATAAAAAAVLVSSVTAQTPPSPADPTGAPTSFPFAPSTLAPTHGAMTMDPTSMMPTGAPTTQVPTGLPTTAAPTMRIPPTSLPSGAPTIGSGAPTLSPSTWAPTWTYTAPSSAPLSVCALAESCTGILGEYLTGDCTGSREGTTGGECLSRSVGASINLYELIYKNSTTIRYCRFFSQAACNAAKASGQCNLMWCETFPVGCQYVSPMDDDDDTTPHFTAPPFAWPGGGYPTSAPTPSFAPTTRPPVIAVTSSRLFTPERCTAVPQSHAPTTDAPVTFAPVTATPTTVPPYWAVANGSATTYAPVTPAPTSLSPTTNGPTTSAPSQLETTPTEASSGGRHIAVGEIVGGCILGAVIVFGLVYIGVKRPRNSIHRPFRALDNGEEYDDENPRFSTDDLEMQVRGASSPYEDDDTEI